MRRFQREIQAAAALDHPNIVRAYDADQIGGTHLLVMECIEGATDLAKLVKKNGPLPVAQACEYIRQAALGLQHAFERGMVHRDIKPANLLLTADGKTVKILDMGLARLDRPSADGEASSTMTQEGAVMGTPDYIAPEQAMESHTVDIRADLYSLGCTFYYLLTGTSAVSRRHADGEDAQAPAGGTQAGRAVATRRAAWGCQGGAEADGEEARRPLPDAGGSGDGVGIGVQPRRAGR